MKSQFLNTCILILIASCISGCSVLKKNKNIQKVSSEQKLTDKTETISVKKNNIAEEKRTDSAFDNSNTISIFFQPGFSTQPDDSVRVFPERENDYEAAPLKKKPAKVFRYVIAEQNITSPVPVTHVQIQNRGTGKVSTIEISNDKSSDSFHEKKNVAIQVKQLTTSKVKVSKSVSYWWILIAIASIAALYFIYQIPAVQAFIRPFLLLFRRKKRSANNENTNI